MARPALNAPRSAKSRAPALAKWPGPPRHFDEDERSEWARIGRAAMVAGTLTEADLLLVETTARLMARLAAAYRDPAAKLTTLGNISRLVKEQLSALGLTPASRKAVEAPAPARVASPLDEF